MDLRFATAFAATNTCAANPQVGDLGITGAKILAPGDPTKSILVQRPKHTDAFRMPPLASSVVDTNGTTLLEQWVQGTTSCTGPTDAGGD